MIQDNIDVRKSKSCMLPQCHTIPLDQSGKLPDLYIPATVLYRPISHSFFVTVNHYIHCLHNIKSSISLSFLCINTVKIMSINLSDVIPSKSISYICSNKCVIFFCSNVPATTKQDMKWCKTGNVIKYHSKLHVKMTYICMLIVC